MQSQLQESFYVVLESEIKACIDSFITIKNMHKDHKKGFMKYFKAYLLDIKEVNVKARCVFCWSGI